jgi:hypothetical protein
MRKSAEALPRTVHYNEAHGPQLVTISRLYVSPRAFGRLQAMNEKARSSGVVLLSGLPADGTEEDFA